LHSMKIIKWIRMVVFLKIWFSAIIALFLLQQVSFSLNAQEVHAADSIKTVEDAKIEEFIPFEDNLQTEDEFTEFQPDSASSSCSSTCTGCSAKKDNTRLWWILSALIFTLIAGILVRYRYTRNLRGFFLVSSIVILGFYQGGCPCPIMSLQQVIMAGIGEVPDWTGMLWFLGLIPITYLFGKVWCGWICHLGALQEFFFLPGKIKILQSAKAQRVMRITRMVLLLALIVQLLVTRTNLFKTIDPFKVAFNLHSANLTGWILLGLVLLTSVFIYRPFCKTVCPIGLILGWISKIPGASVLAPQNTCTGCTVCDSSCKIKAITHDEKISRLDNQECIACGDCVGNCRKGSMKFVRNTKGYASKAVCKKN
jgi:polyferredoxin